MRSGALLPNAVRYYPRVCDALTMFVMVVPMRCIAARWRSSSAYARLLRIQRPAKVLAPPRIAVLTNVTIRTFNEPCPLVDLLV